MAEQDDPWQKGMIRGQNRSITWSVDDPWQNREVHHLVRWMIYGRTGTPVAEWDDPWQNRQVHHMIRWMIHGRTDDAWQNRMIHGRTGRSMAAEHGKSVDGHQMQTHTQSGCLKRGSISLTENAIFGGATDSISALQSKCNKMRCCTPTQKSQKLHREDLTEAEEVED